MSRVRVAQTPRSEIPVAPAGAAAVAPFRG